MEADISMPIIILKNVMIQCNHNKSWCFVGVRHCAIQKVFVLHIYKLPPSEIIRNDYSFNSYSLRKSKHICNISICVLVETSFTKKNVKTIFIGYGKSEGQFFLKGNVNQHLGTMIKKTKIEK
jgi:hypothetical protein